MKKTFKLTTILALAILFAFSCKKKEYEIGEPSSKLEGIAHAWTLDKIDIEDNASIAKEKLDVSDFYLSAPTAIEFKSDKSYSLTIGDGKTHFGNATTGTWKFDDDEFPTTITLSPTGENQDIVLVLTSTIREIDEKLKVNIPVYCGDKIVSKYYFEFYK